ncbi:hypothetical protein [Nonomuraea sp. NPDC049309]|uniref:hypothetical protein n=1 Tax=Nonomuraea sp. NPDC049309 TaxID=3364350 RepID=UPI0037249893
MRLKGRRGAVTLVHALSKRDTTQGPGRPVLLLTGPRGSGKTDLLNGIGEYLDGRLPYAKVDVEKLAKDTVCDVLNMISIDFNRHGAPYGRMAFPRLVLGQIAMAHERLNDVHEVAKQELQAGIAKFTKVEERRKFMEEATAAIAALAGMTIPKEVITAVVGGMRAALQSWKGPDALLLSPASAWYGHQDRGLGRRPLDTLVELNAWAHDRDIAGNGAKADELMLAAFLADLRAAFRRRRRLRRAGYRCVILLDNADADAGRRFLDALMAAGADQDTIVVVATSRGPLTRDVIGPHRALPTTETADPGKPPPQAGRWFPVRLADLSLDHVHDLVRDLNLQECNTRHVEMAVHGFTHGNAGATSLLLKAIKKHPADPVDLRRVLETGRQEASGPRTYGEQLSAELLGDLPDAEADLLATCAAARDMAEAVRMAGKGALAGVSVKQITDAEVWLPGTSGSPAMHPVVRRLLLERLAARDPDADDGWAAVHTWLRGHAAANGDTVGELRHALALGEVEYVTKQMIKRFQQPGVATKTWLDELTSVVSAPCRERIEGPPLDHVNRLKRWAGFEPTITHNVATLVAGLWVANEPLIDSRRAPLYRQIHDAFSELSGKCSNDSEPLTAEAARYGALATRWGR